MAAIVAAPLSAETTVNPIHTPQEMLAQAKALRTAGVLIFERRCWEFSEGVYSVDNRYVKPSEVGKRWWRAYGCGSYFRWMLGQVCMCPFCGYNYDYSQKFPYTDENLWPLTVNYTGLKGSLTAEEHRLYGSHEEGE